MNIPLHVTQLGWAALITFTVLTMLIGLQRLSRWLDRNKSEHTVSAPPLSPEPVTPEEPEPEEPEYLAPSGEPMEDAPVDVVVRSEVAQREMAAFMARLAERKEVTDAVKSVRCPVCRSPEGVTCNPEIPADMPVIHVDDNVFAHGLRVLKAVSEAPELRESVIRRLPDDDLGDELRRALAPEDTPADPSQG